MKIKHRFDGVSGDFDTLTGNIICVGNKKYGAVDLCFKENMNIPFASIKLYSSNRAVDADATFDSAVTLAREIARRWNDTLEKF